MNFMKKNGAGILVLNLIIDIIAKIWYYKTKGDYANGLMKHTTKYNFLSKGGSP